MQKIKDFLTTTLGTFGMLIFWALSVFVCILPLLMFNMPGWLYMLLSLLVLFVLKNIPFFLEILYIVGFFGAISGKQDLFAIIYYVVCAIIVIPALINLILAFLPSKK